MSGKADRTPYTCADYRSEMILLMLHRRLHEEPLNHRERKAIEEMIRTLEAEMGLE